jgi:hypothetical protein
VRGFECSGIGGYKCNKYGWGTGFICVYVCVERVLILYKYMKGRG